ncbi:ABC transporter permease subunit [Massilia arenosa]|uniref:ABC transporter permease subunit n=1 Tax=Zemynaea arenosa TaxID=2561931 RepID=A0A4Y9SQW4_9BURK|nr:ABC transporter permease subunit [Massilia arenosa]
MLCVPFVAGASAAEPLRVGSKRFTESYILGEIVTQTAVASGTPARHLQGLGNTAIVLEALTSGAIDVYPEYTGTIDLEILGHKEPSSLDAMRVRLREMGLGMAVPLGFNNTYALAVKGDAAVRSLSELARHPGLRYGLSHEFIGRADGWAGLARRYGITATPRGLDHGIAYEALRAGQVDVIDIYSTDAKIAAYGLRVLADDKAYFPRYDAVLLYRLDVPARFPAAWQAIKGLEGGIREPDMIALNAEAEISHRAFPAIAHDWLARRASTPHTATPAAPLSSRPAAVAQAAGRDADGTGLWPRMFNADLWRLTRQHVLLVGVSVLLACAIGIPLGVAAAAWPRLRQSVLAAVGILQTVPSLALLAMLIPLLGAIGTIPALAALFTYALLPIVRNTCTGLLQVPQGLKTAAAALGLSPAQRLWHIELPLAAPVMLAGVKTAAVMSVGTATIAAFIGAGGYGERITTGLALNDHQLMLAGAIPAAVLALLTQFAFDLAERHATRQR